MKNLDELYDQMDLLLEQAEDILGFYPFDAEDALEGLNETDNDAAKSLYEKIEELSDLIDRLEMEEDSE